MKNPLTDLHSHLFAQLDRLSNKNLKGEALKEEIERAKAVSSVAKDITGNASLVLDAQKFMFDALGRAPAEDHFLLEATKQPVQNKKAVPGI